jgi:hypothetical protein
MEAKWPFMLIAFGLVFLLGLTLASLEKTTVMNNWDQRRCELPVMMAARFFKPKDDPRTPSDFSSDNFSFCMKTYVDKFMALFMAPINAIFSKQTGVASNAVDMVSTARDIAQTMFNTLLGFMDTYYRKFNASVYEVSRITQYLRMAMRRANAMVIGMLYSGITLFRGMLNSIQFVIKVVLIICGIMLAIIIILWFVLFPVIPIVLSALSAIIATVLMLTMVISGSIADEASSDKSGFCFSQGTKILVKTDDGKDRFVPVDSIKVGQELSADCGKVTAVIRMEGEDIALHNLEGIYVSGSHVVKGTDGTWKLVADDERAKLTDECSRILYCFNTTSHIIPVYSPELTQNTNTKSVILFRDWEEIADDDEKGQLIWNYLILKKLNKDASYNKWKSGLKAESEVPILGLNTLVKTKDGFKPIKEFRLLFDKVLDRNDKEQYVLGLVDGLIEDVEEVKDGVWNTELFEDQDGIWVKGKGTVVKGKDSMLGKTLITDSGEFIIWDEVHKKEKIIRDFTDIGYKSIHETYPFVSERLRITEECH